MKMTVFEERMGEKFGEQWLRDRGIRPFAELADHGGPAVLIWHGGPVLCLRNALGNKPSCWVVLVSAGRPPATWLDDFVTEIRPRVHLLEYGVPGAESCEQQPPWICRKFEEFVRAAQQKENGPPPWHLLRPPAAPEHVLACYLCALAGETPDPAWQTGFADEARRAYQAEKVNSELEWGQDSRDSGALRTFLSKLGAATPAAGGAGNGPR